LKKSYFFFTSVIAVGLTLGVLSKENAILICLYIAAMEYTIFSSIPKPRYWKGWAAICIAGPIISLVIYLAPVVIEYFSSLYPTRTYGPITRLLTETRIIIDYLGNIALPRPRHFGLFHSDYVVSTGLFNPITTVFATASLLLLLFGSIRIRKSYPIISLGILWFFAGHTLESTVLPLELYFEHRNYLPILGIIISVIGLYIPLTAKLSNNQYKIGNMGLTTGIALWCVFIGIITFNETKLWGNPIIQAASWANQHPHSYRAQGHYADLLISLKAYEEARALLEKNTHSFNNDSTHILLWLNLTCYSKTVSPPNNTLLKKQLKSSRYFNATLRIIDEILVLKQKGECDRVPNAQMEHLIQVLQNNKEYQADKTKSDLYLLLAKLYTITQKNRLAVAAYNHAYNINPNIDILLTVAAIHLQESNKKWLIQSIELINQYCEKHKVKCLPYRKNIKDFNKILGRFSKS
jgi:hypothetical protein